MLLTAPLVHDGHRFLPEGTVIETAEDGTITGIREHSDSNDIISYEGILCPGFVNAHCHLELSHMKGMIPEHTGLIPFLQKIPTYRNDFTEEQIKVARHEAYHELLRNGTVAVGDIANLAHTTDLRTLDQLHMHTFVECIGFTEERAQQSFDYSLGTYQAFAAQPVQQKLLRQSIVPHAPYSVSAALFGLIDQYSKDSIVSIHNQEGTAENDFYERGEGGVTDLLSGFGIDYTAFQPSGKTSLQTYGTWLSASHPLILVHNTRSTRADIQFAKQRFPQLYCCLCPNANLYIGNTLPDVNMLIEEGLNICIGTDSLASNHELSILSELNTLNKHFNIDWEILLRWGTYNGAVALNMDNGIGSIQPGKKPGLLNIAPSGSVQRII